MVAEQLRGRDIRSAPVLEAMGRVPRHRFVPAEEQAGSYTDFPLPIGFGQTISQPYIVAFMTQALEVGRGHKVLEIGTGSGYQAAVLAERSPGSFTSKSSRPRHRSRAAGRARYQNVTCDRARLLGWPGTPVRSDHVTAARRNPPALIDKFRGTLIAVQIGDGKSSRGAAAPPDGLPCSRLPSRSSDDRIRRSDVNSPPTPIPSDSFNKWGWKSHQPADVFRIREG